VRKLRTPSNRLRPVLVTALKSATPSLRQIARRAGVSYPAVRMYVRGHRTPAPAVVQRLARALRAQGKRLAKLADKLESASRTTTTRRNGR